MYALHHPEMFSSACPLSAGIGPPNVEVIKESLLRNNESYADSVIQGYFDQHNVLSLINNISDEQIKSVRWFIDCGDDDLLYEGISLMHNAMYKKRKFLMSSEFEMVGIVEHIGVNRSLLY